LALLDRTLNETTRKYLQVVERELGRVAQVTTQALQFHRQATAATMIDVSEMMNSVLTVWSSQFESREISVNREYQAKHMLHCYADELRQVFAHLMSNATDAMPRGGALRIRIKESRSWDHLGDSGIRVTVADTGRGIPAALRRSVFDAFVSTKNLAGDLTGAGLGLWVVQGIIKKHNGWIALRSRTDSLHSGTVVSLFLPCVGGAQ
jgi:signal transduction histidine kinase